MTNLTFHEFRNQFKQNLTFPKMLSALLFKTLPTPKFFFGVKLLVTFRVTFYKL